eukprot:3709022-Prymnesium_polylepis.1
MWVPRMRGLADASRPVWRRGKEPKRKPPGFLPALRGHGRSRRTDRPARAPPSPVEWARGPGMVPPAMLWEVT